MWRHLSLTCLRHPLAPLFWIGNLSDMGYDQVVRGPLVFVLIARVDLVALTCVPSISMRSPCQVYQGL